MTFDAFSKTSGSPDLITKPEPPDANISTIDQNELSQCIVCNGISLDPHYNFQSYHLMVHVPRQKHIFITLGLFTLFSGAGTLISGSALRFELEFVVPLCVLC